MLDVVRAVLVAAVLVCPAIAAADVPLEIRWPAFHHLESSMSDQLSTWASTLGIDIPNQRAHVAVHASSRFVTFGMDENVHYADGVARMSTHLQLELGTHAFSLQLPDVEMQP